MRKVGFYALLLIFTHSLVVSAQKKQESDSGRNKPLVTVRLELVEDDLFGDAKTTFLQGKRIVVRIFATQTGSAPVSFLTKNQYVRYELVLLRDGVRIPLSNEVESEIQAKVKEERDAIRSGGPSVRLVPNKETKTGILNLSDWYGQLTPGVYHLSVKLKLDRETFESRPTAFEVAPLDPLYRVRGIGVPSLRDAPFPL